MVYILVVSTDAKHVFSGASLFHVQPPPDAQTEATDPPQSQEAL